MGPAGHPGDVRVIFTRTSPPAISTSYTRPRSMMFISSSGSFTWRSAWRTASSVSSVRTVERPAARGSKDTVHRGREGEQVKAERRHPRLVLERDQRAPLFPVPALHEVRGLPAEAALAVVNQGGPVRAHGTHRRLARRRPRPDPARPSGP